VLSCSVDEKYPNLGCTAKRVSKHVTVNTAYVQHTLQQEHLLYHCQVLSGNSSALQLEYCSSSTRCKDAAAPVARPCPLLKLQHRVRGAEMPASAKLQWQLSSAAYSVQPAGQPRLQADGSALAPQKTLRCCCGCSCCRWPLAALVPSCESPQAAAAAAAAAGSEEACGEVVHVEVVDAHVAILTCAWWAAAAAAG
jgi:hypothetical protein